MTAAMPAPQPRPQPWPLSRPQPRPAPDRLAETAPHQQVWTPPEGLPVDPPTDPALPMITPWPSTGEQLAGKLAAALIGRPGWWPVQVVGQHGATAEYRPVPGQPGGSVTGCSSGWRWTADDGAGRVLGDSLDTAAPNPAPAVTQVENLARQHTPGATP